MKTRKRAFTLVEILVVLLLSSIVIALFYDMYFGGMIRYWGVTRRIEGEQAVRILLFRLRQELKSCAGLISIPQGGRGLTIPLYDPDGKPDEQGNRPIYYMQYEFDPATHSIMEKRLDAAQNEVYSRLWLGGKVPIQRFFVMATGENDRILFQYYRVIIEVDYYDIKLKQRKLQSEDYNNSKLIKTTCTVYPRRINQELRIEVPQEGSIL